MSPALTTGQAKAHYAIMIKHSIPDVDPVILCGGSGTRLWPLSKKCHRATHWAVVQGTAEVTNGSKMFLLSENQSTYIPFGEVHGLHNAGKLDLEMIEVQSGSTWGKRTS